MINVLFMCFSFSFSFSTSLCHYRLSQHSWNSRLVRMGVMPNMSYCQI